jgi:uncharacterized membrane protein
MKPFIFDILLRKRSLFVVLFLLAFLLIPSYSQPANIESYPEPKYEKGVVLKAELEEGAEEYQEQTQKVWLKILTGKYRRKVVEVEHMIVGMAGVEMRLETGDKVMVFVDEHPSPQESPDGKPLFHVADYARDMPLLWLAIAYALLLVIIGGLKGLRALASLLITIGLLFFVFFPLTLSGINPLFLSVIVISIVSFVGFYLIGGWNSKSLGAAIGTIVGVCIAGILAFFVGNIIHLTGLSSEESRILLYSLKTKLNYSGLLFGSILIGSLGAIMDIGMSIASSVSEVKKARPNAKFVDLFVSGMNIGKDVMGTMSNTLILAYTGSALPLLLLFVANNMPFTKVFNMEIIAVEVLRALAGSIGLVLCVPATAAISSFLETSE